VKDTLSSHLEFIRFDSLFNTITQKVIDLPDYRYKAFHLLKNTSGILVCGYTQNDDPFPFLIQLNNDGIVSWFNQYPITNHFSSFEYVVLCSDKGFITTGTISPLILTNGGIANIWATKTDSIGNTHFVNVISNSTFIPESYSLQQNYPNPFNPTTVIRYSLSENSFISLKVYDILGKEVATLVNEKQNAGTYSFEFNGSNLSSGIYFYKIEAGDFRETKRMVLIK
jgi:Secretion system C-terminal sorting domain